jgi:hypothetical protein
VSSSALPENGTLAVPAQRLHTMGIPQAVLVTGASTFLPDSRGVRSRQCDDFTGRDYPLRAAASTEPWLLAARSPPLVGRAPAWHTTYRELSRLGGLNTMICASRRVVSDQVYSQYIAGPRSHHLTPAGKLNRCQGERDALLRLSESMSSPNAF